MGDGLSIAVGPPEALGEPVRSRLGQSAAIGILPNGKKELYFCSNGSPASFYVIDLISGDVTFSFDIPGNDAVWGLDIASNGDVYFSGSGTGHLYCYTPETKQVRAVAQSEEYPFVWDIQAASDGTIVSATYPRSKLFGYNPVTSEFADLGRMSEERQYARSIAVTEDCIYAGVGTEIALIRYDRKTGMKEELPIEGFSGQKGLIERIWALNGKLFMSLNAEIIVYDVENRMVTDRLPGAGAIAAADEKGLACYFVSGSDLCLYCTETKQTKKIASLPNMSRTTKIRRMQKISLTSEEWKAIQSAEAHSGTGSMTTADEQVLAVMSCYADVWFIHLRTNEAVHKIFQVPEKPLLIQAIESDARGMLYIGGYHRGLCIYDPKEQKEVAQIPGFPQIEGIGLLNEKVYFGTYTKANIYMYDGNKPLQTMFDDENEAANPRFVFPIGHHQDRPFTFAAGDHQLFIGTIPDYGFHTGALTVYDERTDEWTVYPDVAPNLSIVGLACHEGLLYGGTSIWGGLGQEPVETTAHMFIFDLEKKEVIKRFVPEIADLDVPPKMIGELSVGPDGNIWGAIYGTIFVMEPFTGRVLRSRRICESLYVGKFRPVYLRWGEDGLLYSALGRKLVVMDPDTLEYEIIDEGPLSIMTLGKDGNIYYSQGSQLYRRKVARI